VIAIDPGHGGSATSDPTQLWDPGVVVGAIMEKDITLDLAQRLRTLLQRERVKVVLTRTGDQYVEISERWNRAHAAAAQMFVSLHVNAYDGDPSINGLAVFYPKPDSFSFAQAIDAGLAQALKPFQIADDGVAAI
jgi:N-acetylmuramoyl-L-alanine amidase